MKRTGIFFSLWFGLLAVVAFYRRTSPPPLAHLWTVPPFEMSAVTAKGPTQVRQKDLLGHPWIADFIYTRCAGPCPLLSGRMAELQRALPKEVRLVSFTVDPDRDTLPVLRAYASRFHADPKRWAFARGDKEALYKLAYEGFHMAMVEDSSAPSGFRVTHSTKIILVDQKGVIRRFYDASDEALAKTINRDLMELLKEPA